MKRYDDLLREIEELARRTPRHEDGGIMGSMTTWPHPVGVEAFVRFLHVNANDPVTFEVVGELERRLVSEAGRLFEARVGLHTSGGTESNMLALLAARRGDGGVVLAPSTVHRSVDKACYVMGCKLVKVPTDPLKPVDVSLLRRYVEEYKPFAVVITAGTTETGVVDPVREVAELAEAHGFHLHVDAAYGGLLVPFLRRRGLLDEELRVGGGVGSLSVDMHKVGMAPIPSGLLFFDEEGMLERVCFDMAYTPGGRSCGLLGTRPGGALAAAYFTWRAVGPDGYEANALRMMGLAARLHEGLRVVEGVEPLPYVLPIVPFRSARYGVDELLGLLRRKGLYLYRAPSLGALRVVVMPHHREDHVDRLVEVLRELHR